MSASLLHLSSQAVDHPSADEVETLLAYVRLLQAMDDPRFRQQLLRGRNLALLSESADTDAAILFVRAANELGAIVSRIPPSLSDLDAPAVRRDTSQMLGRLYDAIECQGLASRLVEQIGCEAGIPVYDALASRRHPLTRLAHLLDGGEDDEGNRLTIVQAVLLGTIC